MTREELRVRLLAEEFQAWYMLEQIEPYGEFGDWLRCGIIASTMANIHRGKDTPPCSFLDFMPEAFRPVRVETPKTMKEKWIAIMQAQNAIASRRGEPS